MSIKALPGNLEELYLAGITPSIFGIVLSANNYIIYKNTILLYTSVCLHPAKLENLFGAHPPPKNNTLWIANLNECERID
jgi:hypothetical protein